MVIVKFLLKVYGIRDNKNLFFQLFWLVQLFQLFLNLQPMVLVWVQSTSRSRSEFQTLKNMYNKLKICFLLIFIIFLKLKWVEVWDISQPMVPWAVILSPSWQNNFIEKNFLADMKIFWERIARCNNHFMIEI